MSNERIAVYAQDSHDYLSGADMVLLSVRPAEGLIHNYVEPMHAMVTDLIDLHVDESRLIAHILAPAGTIVYVSVSDEDCVRLPGPGETAMLIDDALEMAKASECGLTFEMADV